MPAKFSGETTRHFSTRLREHLVSDGTSQIFRHLQNFQQFRTLCSHDCFTVLDYASTSFYTYSMAATYINVIFTHGLPEKEVFSFHLYYFSFHLRF